MLQYLRANKLKFSTLERVIMGGSSCPRAVIEAMSRFYEGSYANIHRGLYDRAARADAAYDALVGGGDSARVIGGDPSCSVLLSRIAAPDDADVMPPGARMADNELCAIAQWVNDGAKR